MSLIASLGAIEIGLIFGLVALGVFLSFRIINFPDLTVDGSFPLGGAVAAALIVAGWNPFAATAVAIVAGALSGCAHRLAQRAPAHHAAARQHPGDDRAVLDQPAHHGQAQRRADQRAHGVQPGRRSAACPSTGSSRWCCWSSSSAAKILIDLFFASRGRPGDARHRRQPAHGARAGHLDRPPDAARASRCRTRWSRWPARCSCRRRAAPTSRWASAPSSSAWPR